MVVHGSASEVVSVGVNGKHQFHCLGGNIRSSWSRVRAVDSKQATEIRDPVLLHVGTI